ncbi:MAG: hypothetical protein U1B80_06080, partial [Anaerolineaceae bacterium]|nr:hypothetical protein [Anaerolineaceae bacterium]
MTSYTNFIEDFPSRCLNILNDYEESAQLRGREVTLSLAIATVALVIPYERLQPSATDHIALDRYEICVNALKELLKKSFRDFADGLSWK